MKLIIIIIEIIVLLGLSGYRVFEYLNNDNEEIKKNENNNNQDDNKENISEATKKEIKILVYEINIRQEPDVNSADLGDVYMNEVYEVLDTVETDTYTWYKIKKDNIVGYVANQKGENWVEYNDRYLNVNSDFIKNLKIPYRAEFNVVRFNELALKYNHLSNNYDFDFDNEDNSTISALILNYYYYNNVFDSIPFDGVNYSITKQELEKEFMQLFGPDKKFQPTNVLSKNNFICTSGGPYDYVEQKYSEREEKYLFLADGCGRNIPYDTELFVEPYSATKNNEDIIVFYRIAKIKKYVKKDDFGQKEQDDSTTIENINGDSLIKKVGVCDSICEELLLNELKSQNKLPIYKATFKKQSDGNYYFTKGEWQ